MGTVTKLDLETFLEIPIHITAGACDSPLQSFLFTHSIPLDELILQFLQDHEENLMIQFINRLQHFPGVYEELIQSNGFVNILNLGIALTHSSFYLISSLVSSSGNPQLITVTLAIFNNPEMISHLPHEHISELVHSCLQWAAHENISLSHGASLFISSLALLKVEYCVQVVQGIMSQNLDNQLLDTTIKMRYLGMIAEILATGKEEWFASCLRHGATDAILKACELPDILAQVTNFFVWKLFKLSSDGCLGISPLCDVLPAWS